MNKTLYYCMLALVSASMLSTGCMPEELDRVDSKPSVDEIVFYVGHENNVDTKTALANDGFNVNFQSGDAINVFDGTSNIKFATTSTGATATFKKSSGADPAESENYYAHYPYNSGVSLSEGKIVTSIPEVQYAPCGSFDPAANISVAKAAKVGVQDLGGGVKQAQYRLTFLNVGNLVKFHFTENSNVSAIVIRCNGNQNLTGTVKVDPTTGIYSGDITSGSTSITLKPSGSQFFLMGDYYAVMLPQVHTKGISVKMEHEEGSYHFKRGDVNNLEMKRNKIYQLYSGDITTYTEAAVLPSLYMHDGNVHNGHTYMDLNDVTRISFHAMAQDVDWNYADANNVLNVMGTSDVRGYLQGGNTGTLHIYTKKGMFAIPEQDVQAGTADGTQMFNSYQSVTAIDNLSYIDVTFLHSFKNMFYNCDNLGSIDISGWDTSSAKDMNGMFSTNQTSSLHDIVLGEYFVLNNGGQNMFGFNGYERTNKIRVSCPEKVYQQFVDYKYYASGDELFVKQVTWNHGASATKFGEFLNPTIVVTSVNRNVNFTFTIGGNLDTSEIGDITIGFDGYAPTSPQFTSTGRENIDGVDYEMYKLSLTSQQRNDRRVVTEVTAQSTEKNPTHVIMRADHFTDKKFESRIYPYAFSADVKVADPDGDNASANFISNLSTGDWKDYSGHNWPIVGQPCSITFYLKVNNGMTTDEVKLSNGSTAYACTASGSGAPDGYTAWTANNVIVSNTSEIKEFKVLVEVEGQPMLHEAGTVPVKVYGITLGAPIQAVPSEFETSKAYLIKNNATNGYLFTGSYTTVNSKRVYSGSADNLSKVYARVDIYDNFSFWQFNTNSSSTNKLKTINTLTDRYLVEDRVNNSEGNGKTYTIESGSSGLRFYYTSKSKKYYLRDEGTGNISVQNTSSLTSNHEWTVYPVTFTPPVTP